MTNLNTENVFNNIINDTEKRVFHSSGLCQAMLQTWHEKSNWDDGRKKVWYNLTRHYPDYFSDNDAETSKRSLAFLGNIDAIKSAIDSVKTKKEDIFQEKLAGFEAKYKNIILESKKNILDYIQKRKEEIEKLNLGKLEKEIERLQNISSTVAPGLKDIFEDVIENWKLDTQGECKTSLSQFLSEAKEDVSSAEGSATATWTTGHLWWKKHHSEDYTTVKTATVKNAIEEFIEKFNSDIVYFLKVQNKSLVNKLSSEVARFWAENLAEESISIHEIRNAVRTLVLDIVDTDIEYEGKTSFSSKTGTLTYSEAEDFLDEAKRFVGSLKREFVNLVNDKTDVMVEKLRKADFAKLLLKKYENMIEIKKKEAESPKLALEKWGRIQKEIEVIS